MVSLQTTVNAIDFLILIGYGAVRVAMVVTIVCRDTINCKDTIVLICNGAKVFSSCDDDYTARESIFGMSQYSAPMNNVVLFQECNTNV